MKVIGFRDIDGYRIVVTVSEGSADPEATKAEIARQTGCQKDAVHLLPNYSELYRKHKTYFDKVPGPGQQFMEGLEAEALAQAHSTLGPRQRLLITGEIIPDYTNTEYWKKTDGKWEKHKIERVGEAPDGIPADSLTDGQREEIAAQKEEERVAALTPEERAKEKAAKIKTELEEIDRQAGAGRTVRALALAAAEQAGISNYDYNRLSELESRAESVRRQLGAL